MDVAELTTLLAPLGVEVVTGYADTGKALPYIAQRPLIVEYTDLALAGQAIAWDDQATLYCAAGSVAASHNLALAVASALDGARLGGSTLAATIGYVGAQVEGHYESQVTAQINQGALT